MKYFKVFNTENEYLEYIHSEGCITPYVITLRDSSNTWISEEIHDYSKDYFTIESLEDNNEIKIGRSTGGGLITELHIAASTDDGDTWTEYTLPYENGQYEITTINSGDKIMFKYISGGFSRALLTSTYFTTSGNFNVYGNAMSLVKADDFTTGTTTFTLNRLLYGSKVVSAENLILPPRFSNNSDLFAGMFSGCTNLTTPPLVLPETTLGGRSYYDMFNGCTSLETAPVISATTLGTQCCQGMFKGCISLTTAPELLATTLGTSACTFMFSGCTSLTAAPELPATTLADSCYRGMFDTCTSLTTTPELPATTLANTCYRAMFANCSSLTSAPSELPATTLANTCYFAMFSNCSSLTTAPELLATTLADSCCRDMFYGCSSLTSAPSKLFATTLANQCYRAMFYGCSSLTEAPELPATTLVGSCYTQMFSGCAKLNYIKCLATDISADNCTYGWTSGVASSGTFVKASTMEGWTRGAGGIPTNWTVHNDTYIEVTGVTISASAATVNKGNTYTLTANVLPSNADDQVVSWSTSDSSVATVSDGVVTGVGCGDATITVTTHDGSYTAQCTTTVENPVTGVTLNKNTIYIGTGSTYHLVATVSPSDACGDKSVSWSTSDGNVATVSSDGLVTAVASGSAVITVETTTVGPYTASCAVEVTDHDYSKDYLTFDILTSGTIKWSAGSGVTRTISYSINDGEWTEITSTAEGVSINVNADDKVRFKGTNATYASSRNAASTFSGGTATYDVYGNIMSLIGGDDFSGLTSFNGNTWVFHYLFNTSNVISAKNLILPVTTLTNCCYRAMFSHSSGLTESPEFPATTLAASGYWFTFEDCISLEEAPALPAASIPNGCYAGMFSKCTSLTTPPVLSATTLAAYCYQDMFQGCTGLTTAPELPAETLAANVYTRMFSGCTSLTTGPVLSATTLASNCYSNMFYSCRSLTTAPELPATTLASNCYNNMFYGCTSLTTAPSLPATTLASSCYYGMFQGCTSLTTAPVLSAMTLANNCYQGMFYGCSGITTAPVLSATTLAADCYHDMFCGCSNLTTAPELPATIIAASAYTGMFRECISLTTAPVLSATTLAADCYRGMFNSCSALTTVQEVLPAAILANGCYRDMFINCKSLTDSPILPAETLINDCYRGMFSGCASLSAITALFLTTPGTVYTTDWVKGVAASGNFYMNNKATWNPENNRGDNGVPTNWVVGTYGFGGLNIKAIDNVSVTFPFNVEYTNDSMGESWTALTANTSLSINSGDTIFFKSNTTPTSSGIGTISVSGGRYSVGGKPISLIVGDSVINSLQGYDYAFKGLFSGNTGLTDASFMLLPTTLSEGCYESMFEGCTSLSVCPTLSCNELTIGCYKHMLKDCTSIVITPELPATTLESSCYDGMFYGCSSITDAPSLPAETLVSNCYNEMFYNCSSLSAITALFLTTPGTAYTHNWVHGVAASGDFVKNSEATWDVTGDDGVPTGWESDVDYSQIYFTIESLQDSNQIKMQRNKTPNNPTLEYSVDSGSTWTTVQITGTVTFATINSGQTIIFKGTNIKLSSAWDTYNYFNATKQFKVYGNIMSLFNGDNFRENSEFNSSQTNHCAGLFRTTYLVDASNLILPAQTLYTNSYNGMFRGATALQHGPQMLATTPTGTECCASMFEGCINLEEAIEIRFTTLAQQCCFRMFCMNRTSKITTPKMTKSPILRCNIAATDCYKEMFEGNGNLNEITCLLTNNVSATANWVQYAGAATGTFYKHPDKTWAQGVAYGVPNGWTVVDYVEE